LEVLKHSSRPRIVEEEKAAFEHPDSLKRNTERAIAKQIEKETNRGNEANPEGQNKIKLNS